MENIPITDQWKLKGECAKCRRANYCHKDCSAHKKRTSLIAEQAMRDLLNEKYPNFQSVLDAIPHYGE